MESLGDGNLHDRNLFMQMTKFYWWKLAQKFVMEISYTNALLLKTILHSSLLVSHALTSLLPDCPSLHPQNLPPTTLPLLHMPLPIHPPRLYNYVLDPLSNTAAIHLTDTSYTPKLSIRSTDHSTALQAFCTKLLYDLLPTQLHEFCFGSMHPNSHCKHSPELCVDAIEGISHLFSCPTNMPNTLHKLSSIWCHLFLPLQPALGTNWTPWLHNLQNGLPLLSVPWVLYGVIPEPIVHLTSLDTALPVHTVKTSSKIHSTTSSLLSILSSGSHTVMILSDGKNYITLIKKRSTFTTLI